MKNRKNMYICYECGKKIITVELDDGVTPASITCRRCNGSAWSSFYPGNIQGEPSLFWFRPSTSGVKKQTQWEIDSWGVSEDVNIEWASKLQQGDVDKGMLLLAPSMKKAEEWKK